MAARWFSPHGLWCALFRENSWVSYFWKTLLNHHAGWGANTSASTYLWVNEREKRMGNHMDKVMDGLYVGGFLGQYKGQRTKFHTTKNSLKSLNHFDLQEPRRERNWRRTRSLTYCLFTTRLNLSSQMYALFTVVLTDHNFVIIITIIACIHFRISCTNASR